MFSYYQRKLYQTKEEEALNKEKGINNWGKGKSQVWIVKVVEDISHQIREEVANDQEFYKVEC